MKQVLSQLKQYKKPTYLCILMAALEVIMEILLPFVTARIVDEGLEAANISAVYRYGAIMVVLAFLGLFFGAAAGKFASTAASGLASAGSPNTTWPRRANFSGASLTMWR